MTVKSDRWIIDMAQSHAMIEPFSKEQVRRGISYGVSSYGYDFSLAAEFMLPDFTALTELDPKNDNGAHFESI